MSLLVVKGNIVAALPMKGWYVCMYVYFIQHTTTTTCVFVCVWGGWGGVVCVCVYVCVCVQTLRGLGKLEQLAMEMKRYRLSILAVTETHLLGEEEMVMDAEAGYSLLISGRSDGTNVEGVGIVLSPRARAALRHYQAVSP